MNYEKFIVERLEYRDLKLYVHYKFFYEKWKFRKKNLIFKNVKSFTYLESTVSFNFFDELGELKEEIGIEYFSKVFYRSRQKRKLYIFGQLEDFLIIEFNEEKEWNYREQKN